MSLTDQVRGLLDQAGRSFEGSAQERVQALATRLDEPLRVAIAGKVKAGKSTLLNALVGEELAPTDAGECTRIVTWYRDGHTYSVVLQPREGEPRQVRFEREGGALYVDLGGTPPEDVAHLDVTWPSGRLRQTTLIDTPGIESINATVSQRTVDFLTPDDDRARQADAVLYLMRHLHGSDVRFLESFHDDELAQPSPVNALGVLSRADEVGACRLDAMESAGRIAARMAADERLRRLVQTVVPVAGLVAEAAATLAEAEHQALARLAGLPADGREALLLSADRFATDDHAIPVTAVEREALLERFGLFGVRRAIDDLAEGRATTSQALAERLTALSGLVELRSLLADRFAERAGLLKARSALDGLEEVATEAGTSVGTDLIAAIEQVRAGAHELVEVRLLDQLRSGAITLKAAEAEELERLVGGGGPAARLGLTPDASPDEQTQALYEALGTWQSRSESPMSPQPVKDAARVAVRTCEGLLGQLATTTT